jgi:RNA polymerase sigma-70 factor (ECF subfamily)
MAGGRFDGWEVEDLLAAVAEQDRDAFAELYRRTSAKLYAVTLRILGEASRTDDAVHDVFVRVWRSAGSYDAARGRPITWLATMARNVAIDIRRREMARGGGRFAEIELDDIVDRDGSASAEQLAALQICLKRLDPEQRQLVVAAYLNGDSREELAERTNRPIGTIKSWLHRSLAALKACLDG